MDLPATPPLPAGFPPRRTWGPAAVLAVLALALYAAVLVRFVDATASGSDESGYFNHARLLASGTVHVAARELPGLPMGRTPYYWYVPLGLKPGPDGRTLVPTYPVGLPLLILAARPFAGWERGADAILVLHNLAGLLLVWSLGRTVGLSSAWACLGSVIVAASPLYLFFTFRAMSDLPAMVWTTAAVLAAWRARERASWALLAGAALAGAVLIRPSNALAALPVWVALGFSPATARADLFRWALALLGALPGAVFFCLHSQAAYGSWLTTGYGQVGVDFGATWVGVTLAHYAHWLPILFTPIVFFILALPWRARSAPRATAVLLAWIVPYAAFYMTYRCTHETWWYLRFLLPAAPALVAGSLLGLQSVIPKAARMLPPGLALAGACGAVFLFDGHWLRTFNTLSTGRDERAYRGAAAWLPAHIPHDAVILSMQASGALFFDTDYTLLRWDQVTDDNRTLLLSTLNKSKRPLYAVLFPFETDAALREHMPGHWSKVGAIDMITVWQRQGE